MDPTMNETDLDDEFEVDLSNTEGKRSFRIPAGDYAMNCVNVEHQISSTGNPMYMWVFSVVEGDYAGREFRTYTVLKENALWKLAEVLEALGIGKAGDTVRFKKRDVIGKTVMGTLQDSEYNGTERSEITTLAPHPEGPDYGQSIGAPGF